MQWKTFCILVILFLVAGTIPFDTHAALTCQIVTGLTEDWRFDNSDAGWEIREAGAFLEDYNGDGLSDILIWMTNNTTQDRLFCMDSSQSATPKKYPDDRTAWLEIDWDPGTFIPKGLHYVKPLTEDRVPDLVLVGKDKISNPTKWIFRRLDETKTDFEQEKEWSVTIDSARNPHLLWSNYSFNGDNYPDFFIYHALHDAAGKFALSCYNGLDGSEIWTKQFDKATDENEGLGVSTLMVQILPMDPAIGSNGDFNTDGIPEILLFYAYSYGDFTGTPPVFGSRGMIRMLVKNGSPLAGFENWWGVYDYPMPAMILAGSAMWDYNSDGFVDLQILSSSSFPGTNIPVFRVIDLKTKTDLFQTVETDFGTGDTDLAGFFVAPVRNPDNNIPADVDSDGSWDVAIYRMMAGEAFPLKYGIFHGWAGGGANKGRKMWLSDGSPYTQSIYMTNDWDGDKLYDYALIQPPEAPASGKLTWKYNLQTISDTKPTLYKEFETSIDHTGTWNPANDDFIAAGLFPGGIGDVDEDGQRDTYLINYGAFDYAKNGTIDKSYSRFLVFDNTPKGTPPDITADFRVTLEGEDRSISPIIQFASQMGTGDMVDLNGDGKMNDIIHWSERIMFGLSFTGGGTGEVTLQDIVQVLTGQKSVPSGKEDEYDTNDDSELDVGDAVWMVGNP